MKLPELYMGQLEREIMGSRKALERVPVDRPQWKPHEKSMELGYLSNLVATMPSWIAMAILQDELDLAPPDGSKPESVATETTEQLLKAHDEASEKAREALWGTNDDHLATSWRLLVSGKPVLEQPRYIVIADTFTHLAHHRGQLTVYLRLLGEPVPAIYGPSADDRTFG